MPLFAKQWEVDSCVLSRDPTVKCEQIMNFDVITSLLPKDKNDVFLNMLYENREKILSDFRRINDITDAVRCTLRDLCVLRRHIRRHKLLTHTRREKCQELAFQSLIIVNQSTYVEKCFGEVSSYASMCKGALEWCALTFREERKNPKKILGIKKAVG